MIKHIILSLSVLVAGLMVSPSLYASCSSPTPDATLTEQSSPADCLQIETETYSGTAALAIRNDCEQEAVVERVNCSDCDHETVTVAAGDEGSLGVPSAEGETLTSDYRWTLDGDEGSLTVTTETAVLEECNDTVVVNDDGCGGCSATGGDLPASWLAVLLVGLWSVRRRR